MIRTLLKLAVVALIANATWHLFNAYAPNYKLADAVQSASQFRGDLTDEGLHDKILFLASQLDVPAGDDDVKVAHDDNHTTIDITYVRIIELEPGIKQRWPFSIHVDTLNSRSLGPPSKPK